MANVTSGNPIKLTTAVANWAALSLPNGLTLEVRRIFWENPTAAGDTFQFTNADGLVLFESTCEAATGTAGNQQVFYFQPREMLFTKAQGWYLKQISSGTLWLDYVYG